MKERRAHREGNEGSSIVIGTEMRKIGLRGRDRFGSCYVEVACLVGRVLATGSKKVEGRMLRK